MTTKDLINTLRQGKPMTDRLMREIVRELEEKNEHLHTMATALRAKDADYAALREAVRPVLDWWRTFEVEFPRHLEGVVSDELDALAALVGEEKIA